MGTPTASVHAIVDKPQQYAEIIQDVELIRLVQVGRRHHHHHPEQVFVPPPPPSPPPAARRVLEF
jgi:hypothetical protein